MRNDSGSDGRKFKKLLKGRGGIGVGIVVVAAAVLFGVNAPKEENENPAESYTVESQNPSETAEESQEGSKSSESAESSEPQSSGTGIEGIQIPAYAGKPYVAVNGNRPFFKESDLTEKSFENYSPLDSLKRCGVAYASIGKDLMPTEKRGNISSIKPTGWHSSKYDFVDSRSLYNRCHLIGYQLTAENANERNLITGTRTMNTKGMLPFENMVTDYIKETGNHVMYRVTPVFEGDNLVASGVLMEGESVEDHGETILYCVFCYNVEPGVEIDYKTGDNKLAE